MSIKTFAAIEVGSFELTMKIFEFTAKNGMKEVDCVRKRLDLGSDTYARGIISTEKMNELCRTLKEFDSIMKVYKVAGYKAYGTSAIRETENTAIVQDQIEQRTGIHVDILSNSEQRFLDYKAVAAREESFKKVLEDSTAILDIGGGSIQISLFENDTLVSTQNLLLGALRIQDYLNRFEVKHSATENFITEMIMAQLGNYKKLYLKDRQIKNLVIIDEYISPWAMKLTANNGVQALNGEQFREMTNVLRTGKREKNAVVMEIPEEKLPLMFISAVMTERIAELMGATQIWVPGATLCDGIAYEYAEKNNLVKGVHDFEQDIIACAMNISKRYMGSRKRSETLENITSTIFDSMKKIHGLGKRERLYLRLAAILHDCGKYISLMNIGESSYNIIMSTEMIGLSHAERMIVASIVRYNHSNFDYSGLQNSKDGMDREAYLTVAKLTAILRLASGLDRSHKQKLKELRAVVKDGQLILSADTADDISLEKGFFEEKKDFFLEVYSVEPILKQRKVF